MNVNPGIFKANDIRGIFPTHLNEDIAYRVGRAFAAFIGRGAQSQDPMRIIVGRDMRLSGPVLQAAVMHGLTDQGADVWDIGMISTDQYYYACAETGMPGMMVTASHNPKEYNGFKMVRKMPQLLSADTGIYDLRRMVEGEEFQAPAHPGGVSEHSFREPFIERLLIMETGVK